MHIINVKSSLTFFGGSVLVRESSIYRKWAWHPVVLAGGLSCLPCQIDVSKIAIKVMKNMCFFNPITTLEKKTVGTLNIRRSLPDIFFLK